MNSVADNSPALKSDTKDTAIIVLASGQSRRFGGDKRHHLLASGLTMLQQTLVIYQPWKQDLYVIIRPDDHGLAEQLKAEHYQLLVATDAAQGMGHTIANAMDELPARYQQCLIALADMPWVTAETVARVVEKLTATTIVVPTYLGKMGHPVGFGALFFDELRQLSGDRGAKRVRQQHLSAVVELAVNDPGILRDLDHPPANLPLSVE